LFKIYKNETGHPDIAEGIDDIHITPTHIFVIYALLTVFAIFLLYFDLFQKNNNNNNGFLDKRRRAIECQCWGLISEILSNLCYGATQFIIVFLIKKLKKN
jgi:hypothetical protein